MLETSSVQKIKGVGPRTAEVYEKVNIRTVGDLIHYYPRTYDQMQDPADAAQITVQDDGRKMAVEGFIAAGLAVRFAKAYRILTGRIRCQGRDIDVIWYNRPYMRNLVRPGTRYIFRGQIRARGQKIQLLQPKVYAPADYALLQSSLQPVYPLAAGLTENTLRKSLRQAFFGEDPVIFSEDPLPVSVRQENGLMEEKETLQTIHFPENTDRLEKARHCLVFEEFFFFTLRLRQMREKRISICHSYVIPRCEETEKVLRTLPYRLTESQKKVWGQIAKELAGRKAMARLIQGDVGCGKTILAFLALIQTAAAGRQGAMMAPTEVLARQHYESFRELSDLAGLPFSVVLLTGSLKTKEKKEVYGKIERGEALVVIGTHALIQKEVKFRNLSLVITDEQHRFGVSQRETLSRKAEEVPHTIVMSATPIPRTLAVILYGDLDISVIDEMPSGRALVKTAVVDTSYRPIAYAFIASEVKKGHQAYVICPMVEGSEDMEAENVLDYTESLRKILRRYLPDVAVEYLHGKMKNEDKNQIMERFQKGEIKVLVSTTVVEVGVNVPGATVMMIENCERFGLAQLHQLRGRVGRGKDPSYCILMHTSGNAAVMKRLEILKKSSDGFEIARKDLQLRGPGELFGTRQSGEVSFLLADVYQDADILQEASNAADKLLEDDPMLQKGENRQVLEYLRKQDSEGKGHMIL